MGGMRRIKGERSERQTDRAKKHDKHRVNLGRFDVEKRKVFNQYQPYLGKTEDFVKFQVSELKVGEKNEGYFTHKIDINKAKVFGAEGFVWSWFYEDDYELAIKDNYQNHPGY